MCFWSTTIGINFFSYVGMYLSLGVATWHWVGFVALGNTVIALQTYLEMCFLIHTSQNIVCL